MSLDDYAIDPDAQKTGMVVANFGYYFQIAHANNRRFQNRLEALMRPHLRKINQIESLAASADPEARKQAEELRELQQRLVKQAASEYILLNWGRDPEFKDATIEAGGVSLPYSPANAFSVLTDPKYLSVWRFVDQCSSDEAGWQQYTRDLRGKGSSPSGAGSDTAPPAKPQKRETAEAPA